MNNLMLSRRFFLTCMPLTLSACASPLRTSFVPVPVFSSSLNSDIYDRVDNEPFSVDAIDTSELDYQYFRQRVPYSSSYTPGTVVIDPTSKFLYLVEENGQATRYGVGVGREGFGWSGTARVGRKAI